MKYNKFMASVVAGMLSLSLGLVGCGGGAAQSEAPATSETTEATETSATTEATEAPATSETTEAATSESAAEDKVLFWQGETDKGDSLMYSEDDEAGTASIILFGEHDGNDELLAYSGPAKVEGTTVTITDSETGDEFSFTATEVNEDSSLVIDLGEHGTCTLTAVSESEFESALEDVFGVISAVGEELSNMEEQDIEELINIVGGLLTEE